jgi:hypothetical protein
MQPTASRFLAIGPIIAHAGFDDVQNKIIWWNEALQSIPVSS